MSCRSVRARWCNNSGCHERGGWHFFLRNFTSRIFVTGRLRLLEHLCCAIDLLLYDEIGDVGKGIVSPRRMMDRRRSDIWMRMLRRRLLVMVMMGHPCPMALVSGVPRLVVVLLLLLLVVLQ